MPNPIRNRRRTTIGETNRANQTGLQEHGLTLVGTQFQLVLLRRCVYHTARAVLRQPAGVTTAPCRAVGPKKPPLRDTEN